MVKDDDIRMDLRHNDRDSDEIVEQVAEEEMEGSEMSKKKEFLRQRARQPTSEEEAIEQIGVDLTDLPTFAESQFQTIQRRQVNPRANGSMLKWSNVPSRYPNLSNSWEFSGWGSTYYMELPPTEVDEPEIVKKRIGQWRGAALAGNGVIASVLYTIGGVSIVAGKWAPVSLFLVSLVMYPAQRGISEVVGTMSLNGGTYAAILNSAPKWMAVIAACFSVIDYVATVVVSAATATAYLAGEVTIPGSNSILLLTITLILISAIITFFGARNTSTIALGIFCIHLATVAIVMVFSIIRWAQIGNAVFLSNWTLPTPEGTTPIQQIFYGFCVGLLGCTGIETTENYVEEVKPGVFPKIMRNLWWLVFLINAPMTFLATAVVPLDVMQANAANVVSIMGEYAGGRWLRMLIMVDAVAVLYAGVLLGLIGSAGLLEPLSDDRILPQFLKSKNRWTGSCQWIILVFTVLCVTLYSITHTNLEIMNGVYTVAFLCVMCTFMVANMLLKYERPRLPRPIKITIFTALFAFGALFAGLAGNIVLTPSIILYFAIYFVVFALVMLGAVSRVWLLKLAYWCFGQVSSLPEAWRTRACNSIIANIKSLRNESVIFFTKTDEIHVLNKAILYCRDNEMTEHIKLVHVYDRIENIPEGLEANHRVLDEVYPKLKIDLIFIQGTFDPQTVAAISKQLDVKKNLIFISSMGDKFPYSLAELGGLRTIML